MRYMTRAPGTLACIPAWIFAGTGAVPFLFFLGIQAGYALTLRTRVRRAISGVELPSHDLAVLAGLLARLESEPMETERLATLRASMPAVQTGGRRTTAASGRDMHIERPREGKRDPESASLRTAAAAAAAAAAAL